LLRRYAPRNDAFGMTQLTSKIDDGSETYRQYAARNRALAEELPRGPEGKGEVVVSLHLADGKKADLRLGRDFMLEGAVAERLSGVAGLSDVQLSARRGAGRLRLVA